VFSSSSGKSYDAGLRATSSSYSAASGTVVVGGSFASFKTTNFFTVSRRSRICSSTGRNSAFTRMTSSSAWLIV